MKKVSPRGLLYPFVGHQRVEEWGDELQWIRLIFLFITPFIVGELTKSSTQTSNPNGTSVSQVGYF